MIERDFTSFEGSKVMFSCDSQIVATTQAIRHATGRSLRPSLAGVAPNSQGVGYIETEPAAVAVGTWESRVFGQIPKRGGNGRKAALVPGLFHGFHGASFPQRVSGGVLFLSFATFSPTNSAEDPLL